MITKKLARVRPTKIIKSRNGRKYPMSESVVEIIYGKTSKYEIVKKSGMLSTDIVLRKDGDFVGSYGSVQAAVDAANKKG